MSKTRNTGLGWLLACAAGLLPLAAQADVWGYVDKDGMTHFADRKVDSQYQLYFKTGDLDKFDVRKVAAAQNRSFSSAAPGTSLAYNPAADAAAGTKAQRLVALIHQSGAYKSVSPHMRREAARNGVDFDLVKAIIAAESGFNSTAVSSAGAVGLMQIMPATARDMGLQSDAQFTVEQKLTDPALNIRLGTRYMKYLINKFPGRLDLAVAAYNAGHGAVQRAGNSVPRYTETQNYVRTVLSIYQTLKPGAGNAAVYAGATPIPLARMSRQGRVNMTFAGKGQRAAGEARPTAVVMKVPATPVAAALARDTGMATAPGSALDEVASKVVQAQVAAPSAVPRLGDDVVIRDPIATVH